MENYLKILPVAQGDLQKGERYLIQVGFDHWVTVMWDGQNFISPDGHIRHRSSTDLPAYTLPIQ
jgi:hypothetical protein